MRKLMVVRSKVRRSAELFINVDLSWRLGDPSFFVTTLLRRFHDTDADSEGDLDM